MFSVFVRTHARVCDLILAHMDLINRHCNVATIYLFGWMNFELGVERHTAASVVVLGRVKALQELVAVHFPDNLILYYRVPSKFVRYLRTGSRAGKHHGFE